MSVYVHRYIYSYVYLCRKSILCNKHFQIDIENHFMNQYILDEISPVVLQLKLYFRPNSFINLTYFSKWLLLFFGELYCVDARQQKFLQTDLLPTRMKTTNRPTIVLNSCHIDLSQTVGGKTLNLVRSWPWNGLVWKKYGKWNATVKQDA